jgi:purine-binding chemotaxis protein CheW
VLHNKPQLFYLEGESYKVKRMSNIDTRLQLVTFQLGSELYGIDIMDVREIVRPQEVRSIPNAPTYVEGIINLRNEIILIINLHERFDLERAQVDKSDVILSGFLIIELEDRKLGIRIDKVSRVMTIGVDAIREPPKMLSGIGREYIRGVATEDERYLIILDIYKLFDPAELQQLSAITG